MTGCSWCGTDRCLCGLPHPCPEHSPEAIEAQYRRLGPAPEGCKCSRCRAPKLRIEARAALVKIRSALVALGEVPSDLDPSAAPDPKPAPSRKAYFEAEKRAAVYLSAEVGPAESQARPAKPEIVYRDIPTAFVPSGIRAKPDYDLARTAALSDVAEWDA